MADKDNGTVTLLAAGDIGLESDPDSFAELILPVLRQADLRFAVCERNYSERGWREFPGDEPGKEGHRLHPSLASIWKTADIDIISVAGNRTMDYGPDAMLDTVALFRSMGKHPIGSGKDGNEARTPAIVERKGVKIAFLGYCSVLRPGHQAGRDKPGCAPMRAHTYYQPAEWMPGAPPKVITEPYKEDLEALQADIKKAKQQADVVVMSIHWGLSLLPKTICDYQQPVAHAAVDAGADLILGHHAHTLKAVEVYKGKVCFYSIGNFMLPGFHVNVDKTSKRNAWGLYWYRVDPDCLPPHGGYFFPREDRMTMVAKISFGKKGVERVSFLPSYINGRGQPAVVPPGDPKFQEILEFMEWISDQHPHKFRVDGNEVVVDTSA